MTIEATPSEIIYAGNGVTVAFPIPFHFDTAADVHVIFTNAAGLPTEQIAGFSISGGGGSTGTCTFVTAPPLLTNVTIFDDPQQTQPVDYVSNDAFPAETHEKALDRVTRLVKRLNERVDRSLRVADGDLVDGVNNLLPIASARQGKFLGFGASGLPTVLSGTGNDTALRTDLAAGAAALVNERSVDYARTSQEISAGIVPTLRSYKPGNILRYGGVADGGVTNNSPALQAACDQAKVGGAAVFIPGGASFYRFNSTIALSAGVKIYSDGSMPSLRFYGVNGFAMAAGANILNISGVELFGCDASGSADPKTFSGIVFSGTSGSHCNDSIVRDCRFRGWNRCLDLSYTWQTTIDSCILQNSNVNYREFGQCVNNTISNSCLVANTGTHSIQTVKDVAVKGEGLKVSNSLLASGTFGLQTDGYLSINISNCVIDLIADTALDITNAPALLIENCWIFSTNYGIRFRDLGVLVNQQAAISNCRIETTAANSIPIAFGANNSGASVSGGSLTCAATGTARCLFIEAFTTDVDISMVGTNLINPSANPSVFAGSPGFRHNALTGNVTINYFAPDSFTGTLTQVTGTITGTIVYTENGDLITLQIPSILGASPNVNQPQITGIPAAIRPATQQIVVGIVQNNSVDAVSKMTVDVGGSLTLYTGVAAAFTAANNKGVPGCTVTYRRT